MMNNETMIENLVRVVDEWLAERPGQGFDNVTAAHIVQLAWNRALGDDLTSVVTNEEIELTDQLEKIITKHTEIDPDSDHWLNLLEEIMDTMDDLEENAND